MYILTLRTDKPEAEIGLYEDNEKVDYLKWHAHRELSDTLLSNINNMLIENKLDLDKIEGIIIYSGPGSFTGLRIGFAVAKTLAYGLDCKIVSATSEGWIAIGTNSLRSGELNTKLVLPVYGADVHITQPKK